MPCGHCESFDARFGYRLLNGEFFCSLRELLILIVQWRRQCKST
ncbi:hypothetical protein GL4_1174 [Methyloceanibacter caenitepidi]|uniref:Mobile element protein n=1 Tax=Methyloceanibacter caenitepidi TaxID=1384459 RepID=A0A0A8K282_9HYPH|nr:hypothetical protein GL4_1174 [Methyloceanibacter caenitepidi]